MCWCVRARKSICLCESYSKKNRSVVSSTHGMSRVRCLSRRSELQFNEIMSMSMRRFFQVVFVRPCVVSSIVVCWCVRARKSSCLYESYSKAWIKTWILDLLYVTCSLFIVHLADTRNSSILKSYVCPCVASSKLCQSFPASHLQTYLAFLICVSVHSLLFQFNSLQSDCVCPSVCCFPSGYRTCIACPSIDFRLSREGVFGRRITAASPAVQCASF